METVKDIKDFKRFIELNRDKLYASAENANDIVIDDEWMQDDQWDEVYMQDGKMDVSVNNKQIKIENFLLHFSS
ncbi:MAG: hypothetical protein MR029_04000 [Clostridium sp.]|nr:hypothetical protein [Clostridium sp.]